MSETQGSKTASEKSWRIFFRVLAGLVALLFLPFSLIMIFAGEGKGYLWSALFFGVAFAIYSITGWVPA